MLPVTKMIAYLMNQYSLFDFLFSDRESRGDWGEGEENGGGAREGSEWASSHGP